MKITVIKTTFDHKKPKYELYIDNEPASFNCQASRKLTNTELESAYGIFTPTSGQIHFVRTDKEENEVSVKVPLTGFNPSYYENVVEEIIERVKKVNEAFQEKTEGKQKIFEGEIPDYN